MYREIACVVFRQLNFERATLVVDEYVEAGVCPSPRDIARRERILRRPRTTRTSVLKPLMTAASGMSREELDRHVALASTDDFLVLDGSIVLRDAGWSTQSFMFPEVQIRADWGETSKS